MRHIELKDSSVMQEFERMAAEKGWVVQAAMAPAVADQLRKEVNVVAGMLPKSNAVLDLLIPIAETGGDSTDLRHALDALRSAVMDPWLAQGFEEQGGDARSTYYAARSMLHAPESDASLWLNGLRSMRNLLAGNWGMKVEKSELPMMQGPEEIQTGPMPEEHIPGQQKVTSPGMVETGPMPVEHIPSFKADDGMKTIAAVVNELVALANDLDSMGAVKAAQAVDEQLKMYKEAADKLYDVTGETGEQLIGKAHPGGGPTMVPAQDEGGKVETIVEEQKKMLEKATKAPTGKQAAFVAQQLVALANRLEDEGKVEAALLVYTTLDELRRASRRPFVGNLRKEGLNTASLSIVLNNIADAANTMDRGLEDQWGTHGFMIEQKYPVFWGTKNYGAEFGELCEDAETYFRRAAESPESTANIGTLAKDAALLMKAFEQVREIYRMDAGFATKVVRFGLSGSWDTVVEEAFNSFKKNVAALQKMAPAIPVPEAAKKETVPTVQKKTQKPTGGYEWQRLQHTVKVIIDSIEDARRNRRELLAPAFQIAKIDGVPGKDGMVKATRVLELVKKLRNMPVQDEVKSLGYNNWLWNNVVKVLRNARLLKGASSDSSLLKQAFSTAPPGFEAPAKPPAKKPSGRRAPTRTSDDVRSLQAMMGKLGYDLGSTGADGVWGPKTYAAWEKLRQDITAMNGPALPAASPKAAPAPAAIQLAERMAAYVLRVKGEVGKSVNIAPGMQVPERALGSANAFVRALSKFPSSAIVITGPGDILGKENVTAAKSILEKYRESLSQPNSPEVWNIWTEGGGEAGLKTRVRAVDALMTQLEDAGMRTPPSGYEMERGGHPFGSLEKGPDGKSRTRTEVPSAELPMGSRAVQQYMNRLLPNHLMNMLANARQFIWYANRAWPRGRSLKERGADQRSVALTFIEHLRDRLGRVQQRLTPALMARLGADGQAISDRIMQAVSYMDTLEDDIRYGSL